MVSNQIGKNSLGTKAMKKKVAKRKVIEKITKGNKYSATIAGGTPAAKDRPRTWKSPTKVKAKIPSQSNKTKRKSVKI